MAAIRRPSGSAASVVMPPPASCSSSSLPTASRHFHIFRDDSIEEKMMPRASFRSGRLPPSPPLTSPSVSLPIDPLSLLHPDEPFSPFASPQMLQEDCFYPFGPGADGGDDGSVIDGNDFYMPSGPATFVPYCPSDYDLPATLSPSLFASPSPPASRPYSPPSLQQSFSAPSFSHPEPSRRRTNPRPPQIPLDPAMSYPEAVSRPESVRSQQHQHHYHHHHHHHLQHQRSTHEPPARAVRVLRPTLSQSSKATRTTSATARSSAIPDLVSDVSSLDHGEFTAERFDEAVDSIDTQSFNDPGFQLFARLEATAASAEPGSRTSRPSTQRRKTFSSIGPTASSSNWLTKLNAYANTRLPPELPLLRLYMPTWPLLCLAAQFSNRAYIKPAAAEKETYISAADQRGPPKAIAKSVAMDHMNIMIFAVRGSTLSFKDWSTNMDSEPASPAGFLDDPGNLCHSGFLAVAKQMARPVALRLRQMLEENPARENCSLVITGHSAGGAIASLLYAHMLSQTLSSELIEIRHSFKRIHCVTFGAPPISSMPINKPVGPKYEKWLFFSFLNEGDPVVRAEKAYVKSLLELYNSSGPPSPNGSSNPLKFALLSKDKRDKAKNGNTKPVWKLPPATLCLAGRLIVLRKTQDPKRKGKDKTRIEAHLTSNEELSGIVFGDLLMHPMKLYEHRMQLLATDAVTAKYTTE